MFEDRKQNRRRFLGTATAAVAAAQLGTLVQALPKGEPPAKEAVRPVPHRRPGRAT